MTPPAQHTIDPTILDLLSGILKALRSCMPGKSGSELSRMMRCQQALVTWREVDRCQGKLPGGLELNAWGINVDDLTKKLEAIASWQSRYDQVQALVEQGIYWFRAVELAEQVHADAPWDKKEFVCQTLSSASRMLEEKTTHLEHLAEEAPNLDAQEEKWIAVLVFNPRSTKAQQQLQRVRSEKARIAAEEELNKELPKVVKRCSRRKHNRDLPGLEAELRKISAWKMKYEKEFPDSHGIYEELISAESKVTAWRNEIREKLGRVSTVANIDKCEGYRQAKELVEQGVTALPDPSTGMFDDAKSVLDKYRQSCILDLIDRAMQYIDTAIKQAKEGSVELAYETAQQSRSLLDDPVFLPEDKIEHKEKVELIDQRWQAIRKQYDHQQQCAERVRASREIGISSVQRLALLLAIQPDCPDHPRLAAMVVEAQKDVAAIVATDILAARARAERCVQGEHFDEAFDILAGARRVATEQMPLPPANSRLAEELLNLQNYESEISQIEKAYRQLCEIIEAVDRLIERYDEGEAATLADAARMLEELDDKARRRSDVRLRLAAIEKRRKCADAVVDRPTAG